MAVKQEVVRLRIRTSPLNPGDTVDNFTDQLQDALDLQTGSGTLDWRLIQVLEGNVSAGSADYYLVFEDDTV